MKKQIFMLFLTILALNTRAQQVNGIMVLDTNNFHVIKVWGTAQERAYAQGYLIGDIAAQLLNGYMIPGLGNQYQVARDIILNGVDLTIDSVFVQEAMAFEEGYHASTPNPLYGDYVDLLIANSYMDIQYLIFGKDIFNCSSLMNWGDATARTDLDGRSVITSHVDSYPINAFLMASHAIVVNFPSEPNTQPWLYAHLAGGMTPKYGLNQYVGVFSQDMSDYNEPVIHGQGYLPYGYALRKALETFDYNGDQEHNVMDVKAAIDDCSNGFAAAVIISVLAATQPNDSLTAMVCEIAGNAPTHTYRFNSYPDSIPGDNLYTANYQIARNNAMNFCSRYNGIVNNIGNGTMIGVEENWNLMKDYSLQLTNIQAKQYAPEADLLKMAIRTSLGVPAANTEPYVFSLEELFTHPYPTGTVEKDQKVGSGYPVVAVCPNPVRYAAKLEYVLTCNEHVELIIYNHLGQLVETLVDGLQSKGRHKVQWDASGLPAGIYFYRLQAGNQLFTGKIIKIQ